MKEKILKLMGMVGTHCQFSAIKIQNKKFEVVNQSEHADAVTMTLRSVRYPLLCGFSFR